MLPVPFLLLFWNGVTGLLSRVPLFKRPIDWLFARTKRHSTTIGKYKFWGLLAFVAVPIPLTGAWTASLVAIVLGMKFWPSFWSIFGGVIVAGAIVTALSLMGWRGAAIAVIGFIAITIWSLLQTRKQSGAASK
jgi:uncharacterized membrane protein